MISGLCCDYDTYLIQHNCKFCGRIVCSRGKKLTYRSCVERIRKRRGGPSASRILPFPFPVQANSWPDHQLVPYSPRQFHLDKMDSDEIYDREQGVQGGQTFFESGAGGASSSRRPNNALAGMDNDDDMDDPMGGIVPGNNRPGGGGMGIRVCMCLSSSE
jgi:hypothetical protein